jgi:sterol desaturase/sphingolipid hydroxylase (fatty acid hydroxylase superfamily)
MELSFRSALIGFSLLALLASFLEGIALTWRKQAYNWRAFGASLFIAVGRRITDLVPLWFVLPGGFWLHEHRLLDIPMASGWSWVALFIGLEFFYYWFHRASHRVRWFWASHSVHHSPNEFNFSAAYRLSWTGKLTLSLIFFLPLTWIGFPPTAILGAYAINLLYQFWIHAQWIPSLGLLEGIFNTPSAHRVHHAANLEYLDTNYGGVLLVFDRLFGTYAKEMPGVSIRYGWVDPLLSNNPFKIMFAQWIVLIQDVRHSKSIGEVFGYLWAPPGWSPNGAGKTTEALRASAPRKQVLQN